MLVAVFALGSLASASASAALPEFVHSVGETFPVNFSGTGSSAFWQGPGYSFTCTSFTNEGSISGAKTIAGTHFTFKTCFVIRGESRLFCKSVGAEKGEIKTEELEGTPVYISKTAKTVGILFKAQSGTKITKLEGAFCGGEVRGSIVMPITSVNTRTTHFTLKSHSGSTEYETESGEKKVAKLEAQSPGGGVFEPLSWEFEALLSTSKSVEIKA